jgi:C4-dicarboxylate-specific signal transduction histidine kinase
VEDVFSNIIVNAYQAMEKEGGTLSVEIKESDGQVVVSISDEGAGIKGGLDSIYGLFHTTKRDGIGFGLFRARRVIKAHHGSVVAMNNPGRGATFTIRLPIQ